MMEKEFDAVPVELLNLDNSLEIQGEPPVVSFRLSGSMPVLENYILSKHAVQMNLHDITEPGNYNITLRYVLPANLQLIDKSDDELSITVVHKTVEKIESEANAAMDGE